MIKIWLPFIEEAPVAMNAKRKPQRNRISSLNRSYKLTPASWALARALTDALLKHDIVLPMKSRLSPQPACVA